MQGKCLKKYQLICRSIQCALLIIVNFPTPTDPFTNE